MTATRSQKRSQRRWLSRFRLILGTAIGFAGLYYLSYHHYGIVGHFETRDDLRRQNERRERLTLENAEIEKTIERLKTDSEYIEKIARERYLLSKEGEQIYRIRKDPAPDSLKQLD